jgi:hypothetical protein
MMRRIPNVFTGTFSSTLVAVGLWLKSTVAVRSPHHCDITLDTVERDDAVHPLPLDGRFALQFKTEFGKERDSGLEVVDNDANVVRLQ